MVYQFIHSLAFSPQASQAICMALAHSGQILRGRLPLLSPAFRRSHLLRQVPSRPTTRKTSSSGRWNSSWARNVSTNFVQKSTSTQFQRSFTCRKATTLDRRFYFPSEGRRAEDFFALKNPTASAGFEPANLGTKGQYATSRPPKPIVDILKFLSMFFFKFIFRNLGKEKIALISFCYG